MAKKSKRVIVDQVYLELIERKAELLDRLCNDYVLGTLTIDAGDLQELKRIQKDWNKRVPDCTSDPYEEPPKNPTGASGRRKA